MSNSEFLKTVFTYLPEDLESRLSDLMRSCPNDSVFEDALRFVVGAEGRASGEKWDAGAVGKQVEMRKALDGLLRVDLKRRRDKEGEASSKKARIDEELKFILHSVSATSPVRRKVDLAVTQTTLTVVNSGSQAVEAVVPLRVLHRAFVVPTRGKTREHWTVVVLSARDGRKASAPQIIFGVDAAAAAPLAVTDGAGAVKTALPKGTLTIALLRTFLGHLGLPDGEVHETDVRVFKSAAKEGVAGTAAHLGSKEGTLWFFRDGVLWGESRLCEYWPVEEVVDVRVVSATGRQCSATIVRRGEGEGEGEEWDVETEFSFIDGREQDAIRQWVRRVKGTVAQPGYAGPATINSLAVASDDEDGDYTGEDSTEDSSATTSGEEDASGDDELKPEHHPLMRPGAMPKISKAAMNMVVDIMQDGLEEDELDG